MNLDIERGGKYYARGERSVQIKNCRISRGRLIWIGSVILAKRGEISTTWDAAGTNLDGKREWDIMSKRPG